MSFSKASFSGMIVICLMIGALAGYFYSGMISSSQINELQSEVEDLQNQLDSHQSELDRKNAQISSLQSQMSELETDYTNLEQNHANLQNTFDVLLQDYNILGDSYSQLLNTLDIMDARNLSRTEEFQLGIGHSLKFDYDIGYGIIWTIDITLTYHGGTRFICYISWREGEQGGVVSGSAITVEQTLSGINGTISTEIFDEGDAFFIYTVVLTNIQGFNRDGSARLLKSL